jgi:hypothetical protein
MRSTRTRLVGLAVALSTIAIAVPVSSAAAATASAAVDPAAVVTTAPDGSPSGTLATDAPAGTIVGPRFVTVGTATFNNLKIVTTTGNASS